MKNEKGGKVSNIKLQIDLKEFQKFRRVNFHEKNTHFESFEKFLKQEEQGKNGILKITN